MSSPCVTSSICRSLRFFSFCGTFSQRNPIIIQWLIFSKNGFFSPSRSIVFTQKGHPLQYDRERGGREIENARGKKAPRFSHKLPKDANCLAPLFNNFIAPFFLPEICGIFSARRDEERVTKFLEKKLLRGGENDRLRRWFFDLEEGPPMIASFLPMWAFFLKSSHPKIWSEVHRPRDL